MMLPTGRLREKTARIRFLTLLLQVWRPRNSRRSRSRRCLVHVLPLPQFATCLQINPPIFCRFGLSLAKICPSSNPGSLQLRDLTIVLCIAASSHKGNDGLTKNKLSKRDPTGFWQQLGRHGTYSQRNISVTSGTYSQRKMFLSSSSAFKFHATLRPSRSIAFHSPPQFMDSVSQC